MPRTVVIGEFAHETNTFSKIPTTVELFRARQCLAGDELLSGLKDTNTEIAGFMDRAAVHGWRLVPTVSTTASPGGRVTRQAVRELGGMIVDGVRANADCDGVLLALHGAMVTEGSEDGESELLAQIREIVGPKTPIAVTLDLHANVTDRMTGLANILVSYRTYPHIDMRDRGADAADLLERAMAGEIRPRTVAARRPLLQGCNHGRTHDGPMIPLLEDARRFEREPGVLAVSINAGFWHADIFDAGPTVTVTGDGDDPRYRQIAETLMDKVWERRDDNTLEFLTPEKAVGLAVESSGGTGPVVIADFADNPGGGGYGDATNLLRAMLEGGLENAAFGGIWDPEAAQAMTRAGEGAEITLDLGGRTEPAMGGGPVTLTGTVVKTTDGTFRYRGPMHGGVESCLGPSAVIRSGGVDVVVVSHNMQWLDLEMFFSNGIDPREKSVVAVKSMQHFRAAFGPIARQVLVADCGALCTPSGEGIEFNKVRRPVYPLNSLESCLKFIGNG